MQVVVYPVVGKTTVCSPYGDPRGEVSTHHGIDLCAPMGTPVLAVDNGEVRYGTDPKGGNVALLDSDSGGTAYYAHLSRFEGSNRSVEPGDVLGYVGMSGNAATTLPHLHFELWRATNNYLTYYDPTPLINVAQRFKAPPVASVPRLSNGKAIVYGVGIVTFAGLIAYAVSGRLPKLLAPRSNRHA